MNTEAVLTRCLAIWNDRIHDPHPENRSAEAQIHKLNISRFISEGLGKPGYLYVGDPSFQWCGAFAAYCWAHGGLPEEVRKTHETKYGPAGFASTYKLWNLAENGELERITPSQVQPADIVVIGDGQWGRHITLAVNEIAEGKISCVGGNQVGRGPDGRRYQGVTEIFVGILSIHSVYRPR